MSCSNNAAQWIVQRWLMNIKWEPCQRHGLNGLIDSQHGGGFTRECAPVPCSDSCTVSSGLHAPSVSLCFMLHMVATETWSHPCHLSSIRYIMLCMNVRLTWFNSVVGFNSVVEMFPVFSMVHVMEGGSVVVNLTPPNGNVAFGQLPLSVLISIYILVSTVRIQLYTILASYSLYSQHHAYSDN